MVKARAEQQRMQIDASAPNRICLDAARNGVQGTHCRRQLEIALVDLAIKKQGLQIDTASAVWTCKPKQQGMAA
jgi:hypothetical protein